MILNSSTVEVTRQFHVPAAKLFEALGAGVLFRTCGADPATIKVDFREGGAWSVGWKAAHPPVHGKIVSLVKNEKIVFTWGDNGTVTITLKENKGVTEMRLLHEGIKENVNDFDWGWRDGVNDFTPTQTRTLKVTREFHAPVAKAFTLFASPEFMVRCKADPSTMKWDFKVGGKYSHEKTADCSAKHLEGEFTDIQPEKRIAYTWDTGGIHTLVLIDFKANGDRTSVTLTHAGFPDEETQKGHEQGWNMVLDGVKKDFG